MQDMDVNTFYGRKKDVQVRAIPTDSKDSELDSDSEDQEECIPESEEIQPQYESETEKDVENETEEMTEGTQHPKWKRSSSTSTSPYPEWQGQLPTADDIKSPLQYFREFFSKEIIEVIVQESNLYAIQKDPSKPLNLTVNELEQFLGTVVYMSLFGLPASWMYWNKATRVPQVADTMTLNRWEVIKHYLHFSNNQQQEDDEPLYKIHPLVSHLTSKLTSIPMTENLSVDEQMVPFKGRHRWDRQQKGHVSVPRPAVVKEYNKSMGGVDLLDSIIALYRTKVKSTKWYHRLVFHFLDMMIATSWLLYRRDCKDSGLGRKE
ncbi:hypothetical protein ACEWY4_007602 [Coilia grayii]|uniref:PiggyBac transposable element-derived protein domain-containing protein n=1 Tax=Coilia grayii TaxID=363190 RepID=A0ABD1KGQ1_9TELE